MGTVLTQVAHRDHLPQCQIQVGAPKLLVDESQREELLERGWHVVLEVTCERLLERSRKTLGVRRVVGPTFEGIAP